MERHGCFFVYSGLVSISALLDQAMGFPPDEFLSRCHVGADLGEWSGKFRCLRVCASVMVNVRLFL